MSDKPNTDWEKFLTGSQDKSMTDSPVTSVKSKKTTAPVAESKRTTPETLEEKIARVMAGINIPKKGGATPATKPKSDQPGEKKVLSATSEAKIEEVRGTSQVEPLKSASSNGVMKDSTVKKEHVQSAQSSVMKEKTSTVVSTTSTTTTTTTSSQESNDLNVTKSNKTDLPSTVKADDKDRSDLSKPSQTKNNNRVKFSDEDMSVEPSTTVNCTKPVADETKDDEMSKNPLENSEGSTRSRGQDDDDEYGMYTCCICCVLVKKYMNEMFNVCM